MRGNRGVLTVLFSKLKTCHPVQLFFRRGRFFHTSGVRTYFPLESFTLALDRNV
jgi:hypothetical protein